MTGDTYGNTDFSKKQLQSLADCVRSNLHGELEVFLAQLSSRLGNVSHRDTKRDDISSSEGDDDGSSAAQPPDLSVPMGTASTSLRGGGWLDVGIRTSQSQAGTPNVERMTLRKPEGDG